MHSATDRDERADQVSLPESTPDFQWLRATLLVLTVWSTYLSVPLLSGGRLLIPSFSTIVLAPLLLLAVLSTVSKTDIKFLIKVTFILLLSIGLSPGYEHIEAKLLGLIQCVLAIGVAVLTVHLMQTMRFAALERTLLVIWCTILGGSILELMDITRAISDTFREWAYEGVYTLYAGHHRDLNLVGWLRPKLFSIEPSHVTKFFIAAVNSWLLLRVTWKKVWIVAAATLAMLVIMGSPMLLVAAAITLAIVFFDRRTQLHSKIEMVFATLLLGVIFGVYYGSTTFSNVTSRLATVQFDIKDQSDVGSEEGRIVQPYLTLADTMLRWPAFGVGISGKEVLFDNSKVSFRDPDAAIGNNVMAEMWVYLGLIGGAMFLFTLQGQARSNGVVRIGLLAIVVALFSQLMGGMVTFRYWGFIALLWGALSIADSRLAQEPGRHDLEP